MAREHLKQARKAKGMTQQAMADKVFITLRQYQYIEAGGSNGSFEVWDALEDFLKIPQRKLREISENHPAQAKNP